MDQPVLPQSPGTSRRTVLRAAGAGSALLALSACRAAVDEGAAPGAGAQTAGSSTPRRGGTLALASPTDFTPSLLFAQSAMSLPQRLVYNTLTRYDDRLQPQPELATEWQVSGDGRAVTLKLRDDVVFHNGRPFTADDVIFAVKNLQNPLRAAQLRSTALAVAGFEKRGDHEIVLTLAHPVSNLFDLFEFMIITDRDSVEDALAGKRLIGTGPFTFQEWNPGSLLRFARNDRYWRPGRPYLDGVDLRIIPQSDTLLSSLRTGQTQLTYGLAGKDAATLKDNPRFRVKQYATGSGAVYLGVNVTADPVRNKLVRQALAWAVDRDRIVQQALGGYGLASAAPWPASSPAYTEANARHYTHDPAKARELLKSAGVTSLDLPLLFATTPGGAQIAQMVQYDLQQVGVRTTLQPTDPATGQKRLISQSMPALWTMGHGFAQVHPATLAVSAYPFNEAKNTSKFHSADYTDAVQRAWKRTDADSAEARALYQRISDILLDEAFIIDLAVLASLEVSGAAVQGVTLNKFSYLNLDDAHLA
ncbi:ABC transporter substrate-binding protein [Peterkaempfera griseoplana]|uniref:ABC transporter substrate-binding protein n=1 Tax=Peterkaempfera griseoplana TaxID=66896 RepID=UPI0006E1B509|nr:ABC transporter substrate-binding protein [Peterkaempfera griseoplana]